MTVFIFDEAALADVSNVERRVELAEAIARLEAFNILRRMEVDDG